MAPGCSPLPELSRLVDLVFYGNPGRRGLPNLRANQHLYLPNEPWPVFVAQNLNVLAGGAWTQPKVAPAWSRY